MSIVFEPSCKTFKWTIMKVGGIFRNDVIE